MSRDVNVDQIRSELDELHKSRNDIDRLIKRKRVLMLQALPGVHSFASMDEFIGALARFASKALRDRICSTEQRPVHSRKGIRYTAEMRVAVRKALEAGESASAIARAKGMSAVTIARWSRLWGLDSNGHRKRARGGTGQRNGTTEAGAGEVNGDNHDPAP